MEGIWNAIRSVWQYFIYAITNMRIPFDIIDILVIAFVIYYAIAFLRETRAGQLVKGLIILFSIYLIAQWWELAIVELVLSKIVNSAIIVAVVVFQPELRRILEKMGHTEFRPGLFLDSGEDDNAQAIDSICRAAGSMQDAKIGALIVFERKTQLGDIINTGTVLDAKASIAAVSNIFFPKSPLHDGAIIIRDGRIYAAGCILPLTSRADISAQLGTRHRAAIGMTENSDAVVLVVSEETGIISIVSDGEIKRGFNSISAREELNSLLLKDENSEEENTITKIVNKLNIFKSKKGKEEKK